MFLKLFVMFVVDLHVVQKRLHFAKRSVCRQTRLSVKLCGMRRFGRLHEMRKRVCSEKRGVRGQAENANRVLSARQNVERRFVLLYFKMTNDQDKKALAKRGGFRFKTVIVRRRA